MRFYFRPLLGLSISCAILFALLMGLGVWQIQRLHWKLALIASVNRQMHLKPIELDDGGWLYEERETDYLPVTVKGRFLNGKEVYLFAPSVAGDPGYHVLTPLVAGSGRIYLVDRGFVSRERLDPEARREGQIANPVRVTGIWRWPAGRGYFTPPAEVAHRLWYWRDLAAIEAFDHIHLFQPGILEADATPNPGGWPKGGQTVVSFPNNHLSYALTWFGLAGGLLGVYLAFHISKGRLTFGL